MGLLEFDVITLYIAGWFEIEELRLTKLKHRSYCDLSTVLLGALVDVDNSLLYELLVTHTCVSIAVQVHAVAVDSFATKVRVHTAC